MTGRITILVTILGSIIIAREGYHPIRMLGAAATGDLVLKSTS